MLADANAQGWRQADTKRLVSHSKMELLYYAYKLKVNPLNRIKSLLTVLSYQIIARSYVWLSKWCLSVGYILYSDCFHRTDEIIRYEMVRADCSREQPREWKIGVWVTNHVTKLCSCSEHKMIARKTTRQSYAFTIRSFDTAHSDARFMYKYFCCTYVVTYTCSSVLLWHSDSASLHFQLDLFFVPLSSVASRSANLQLIH